MSMCLSMWQIVSLLLCGVCDYSEMAVHVTVCELRNKMKIVESVKVSHCGYEVLGVPSIQVEFDKLHG